ncbi:hypothetical protein RHECNPAF_13300102 [Rhizobium etli CNPAF512]|nr:hypothetical protein RHECNPAF_13300102 [Rhizobium etli CNPAF512]
MAPFLMVPHLGEAGQSLGPGET